MICLRKPCDGRQSETFSNAFTLTICRCSANRMRISLQRLGLAMGVELSRLSYSLPSVFREGFVHILPHAGNMITSYLLTASTEDTELGILKWLAPPYHLSQSKLMRKNQKSINQPPNRKRTVQQLILQSLEFSLNSNNSR